jgi:hypothetical protein
MQFGGPFRKEWSSGSTNQRPCLDARPAGPERGSGMFGGRARHFARCRGSIPRNGTVRSAVSRVAVLGDRVVVAVVGRRPGRESNEWC